jgi:hypothetical protein
MRNTRFIAGIIAFIGTFAVSVGLVWLFFGFPVKQTTSTYTYSNHNCRNRQAGALYSFLQRDISNGRERDVQSFPKNNGYSIKTHADSVAQYVEESGSMDASGFPREFQNAWREHMDAWRSYSEFLNERKNSSRTKVNGENLEKLENPYNTEINRTWDEVLRIARRHGADVE